MLLKKKQHRFLKMELELGLKITRARDDVSSSTDFKVSRDVFGQVWHSRETDSVFILTLHLKGFKKDGIDTEINKEGDQITIRGRKQVEEMVLIKWVEWKKETDVKEFKKVFWIPKIANLDKVKGVTGLKIKEVEEAEPEAEKTEGKTEPEAEKTEEKPEPEAEKTEEKTQPEEEIKEEDEEESKMGEEDDGIMEEEETKDHEEDREEAEEKESKPKRKKRKKLCFPCIAGSTLLMSIIVFIIQLIQSKRK